MGLMRRVAMPPQQKQQVAAMSSSLLTQRTARARVQARSFANVSEEATAGEEQVPEPEGETASQTHAHTHATHTHTRTRLGSTGLFSSPTPPLSWS